MCVISLEEKTDVILFYAEAGLNVHEAERLFNASFHIIWSVGNFSAKLSKNVRSGSAARAKGARIKSISQEKQV